MKRVFVGIAIAIIFAGTRLTFGQVGGHNPFVDHSDTGETVHVLPAPAAVHSPHDTQPTFAPPRSETIVYGASYGSGTLRDHLGPQIANAGFWAIYWNSSVANSNKTTAPYTTVKQQLDAFINNFPNNKNWDDSSTADYSIVQQYGSRTTIDNSLMNWGVTVDTKATQSSINDSNIQNYLAGLFTAHKVPVRNDTIYGIYFPHGMRVLLQGGASCSSFCGYHGHFNYGGLQIKYAAFPFLDCSACSISGLSVADMLTIVGSHEIREAVTDPELNSWYDAAGYEADDKCAWHNLYKMTNGGFWVQPEYSNGGTVTRSGFTATYPGPGCVVPNR